MPTQHSFRLSSARLALPAAALRALIACLVFAGLASTVQAAEADAPSGGEPRLDVLDLLPADTVVMVDVPDAALLRERLQETTLMRMTQDEAMRPLLDEMMGSLAETFATVEEKSGLTVDQLMTLPSGRVVVALVAAPGRGVQPVAIIDVGSSRHSLDRLLEQGGKSLQESGIERRTETIEGTQVTIFGPGTRAAYFERDDRIVIAMNLAILEDILLRWAGDEEALPSLAENQAYAAAMQTVRGDADASLFYDPIGLVRGASAGNAGAAIGMAMLPVLGLDGVLGVGGSLKLAEEQFDVILDAHLALANPRGGLVDMVSFTTGDTTPEDWVPGDVADYMSFYFDFQRSYGKLTHVFDNTYGPGTVRNWIKQNMMPNIDADLEEEILPQFGGRMTIISRINEDLGIQNGTQLLGIQLTDAEKFAELFERVRGDFEGRLDRHSYQGITYYVQRPPQELEESAEPGQQEDVFRPCYCLLGDYMLFANHPSIVEAAIGSYNDPTEALTESLEFKLIASRAARQSGEDFISLLQFTRPAEKVRALYAMARSQQVRDELAASDENNPVLQGLRRVVEGDRLPPFEVVEKYLAPGGASLVDTPTGLHYTLFRLRRDAEE